MSGRSLALLALALVCAPAMAHAATRRLIIEPGNRPKDFAFARADDGQYHVIYIRADSLGDGIDLSHARSSDLVHWTLLGPAFTARQRQPLAWDRDDVWAPSIVRDAAGYAMFYTGVRVTALGRLAQHIGLARAPGLDGPWTRVVPDQPVCRCDSVHFDCDTLGVEPAFRDPFVMQDPADSTRWLMWVAARAKDDPGRGTIGLFESGGDLTEWSFVRELTEIRASKVESPHVWFDIAAGQWRLAVSGNPDIVLYTRADGPGSSTPWLPAGGLADPVLGQSWPHRLFASEYLADMGNDWFVGSYGDSGAPVGQRFYLEFAHALARHGNAIGVDTDGRVSAASWDATTAKLGDSLGVTVSVLGSRDGVARLAVPRAYLIGLGGVRIPISIPGWPGAIAIDNATSRTGHLRWLASDWTGKLPPTGAQVVLRFDDGRIETPPLLLLPASSTDVGPLGIPVAGAGIPASLNLEALAVRGRAGGVRFRIGTPESGEATLELFDVAGRRIRRIALGRLAAGVFELDWDGALDDGRRAPAGVCFARVSVRGDRRGSYEATASARAVLIP